MCCVIALILFVGCAHQVQFRVVDASSMRGIPGATVNLEEFGAFSYFNRERHEHPVGSTDTNGIILVRGIRRKHAIYFRAAGYRGATAGLIESGKIAFGPDPPRDVDTMYLDRKVVDSDGVVVIPLLPMSGKK